MACAKCGYYNGRAIIEIKDDTKKKRRR